MELTDSTINILKNYATINPNIVVESGNTLKTISVARNLFSSTETVGSYDLNEFLNVLSLVQQPTLSFANDYVVVSDNTGRSSVKYFFSDPDMLTSPSKSVNMPDAEVKFSLDTDTLSKIKRASAALGHDEISITPSDGAITLTVKDSKDATSNTFAIDVEGEYPEGVDFNFILNVANLKVINEDFDVSISSKLISQFTSKQSATEYFIALEKTSVYGA